MSVKETIIEKMRAAGYDMITASEEATRAIREFLASGKKEHTLSIRGANGKAVDAFTLRRK